VPDSSLPKPRLAGAALEHQLALQRSRRPADPLLSLVVPVFDEDESIDLFIDTVVPILERDRLRFEIVFVNDGSRDDTLGASRRARWRIGSSPVRNFGGGGAGIDMRRDDPDGPAGPGLIGRFAAGARATTSSTACAAAPGTLQPSACR
jgi:hypothetical protein